MARKLTEYQQVGQFSGEISEEIVPGHQFLKNYKGTIKTILAINHSKARMFIFKKGGTFLIKVAHLCKSELISKGLKNL